MNRRPRILCAAFIAWSALAARADDVIIPVVANVAGANGTHFRTDLRMRNPASEETISVEAELRLSGSGTSVMTRTLTVGPGRMLVLNDVVGVLFGTTGLATLRLQSTGAFDATSRTYTDLSSGGTNGQFVPAVPYSSSTPRALLLHLSQDSSLSRGFRTNVGVLNPTASPVPVSLTLFSSDGSRIGQRELSIPAGLSQTPLSVLFNSPQMELSDGFVRLSAETPVIAYASVVDNLSGDSILVPAVPDRGQPPSSSERIFDVVASQFKFEVSPGGFETIRVNVGDRVVLRLRSRDALHGFLMPGIVAHQTLIPDQPAIEMRFTADRAGTFPFQCTIECGSGHHGMSGQMIVSL